MISRRGFFGMLAGLAASPFLPKTALAGKEFGIKVTGSYKPSKLSNRCGSGEMGTLYWSKQSLSE